MVSNYNINIKEAVLSRSFGWLVGLVEFSLFALTGIATSYRQQTRIDVGMVALIAAPNASLVQAAARAVQESQSKIASVSSL
jgi:hypothetical protein